MKVNAYLNFLGNCEEAFNYYKSVFGGEFTFIGKFRDMPPQEGAELSDADNDKIMHVALPIGPHTMIMGSDSVGEWAPSTIIGNNIALAIAADSRADADRLYNSLSAGGTQSMPMADMFWGDYYGMCVDKFGINWMVTHNERADQQN
jgi:PhnB protein